MTASVADCQVSNLDEIKDAPTAATAVGRFSFRDPRSAR